MTQKRFNSLAVLSFHKELTDKISLVNVANEFVASKPSRKNIFGKFVESDFEHRYSMVAMSLVVEYSYFVYF